MAAVDAVIARRLQSDVVLVQQVSTYIVGSGGKRMRPRLLLLMAMAMGYSHPDQHELAATVEFIHTSTLLHDDVVDESALRRGRATANATFGNAASVLVGDFLYSRAFQMMVSTGRMRVLEILAEATNIIAEGEVLQLMNMHDPEISVERYLQVIRCKTAKLFEASARLGAVLALHPREGEPAAPWPEALAGQSADSIERGCADFGASLGTAFQLVDDILDYEGDTHTLGKNIGDDLREGKATLPLLVAMSRCSDSDRAWLRQCIEHGEVDRLPDVIRIVRETGALDATRDVARAEVDRACEALAPLPESPVKDTLLHLARTSLVRLF
ncbi:polyprenyl synthetase family protein [Amphibiibacter pelophylacis]|uniref:Polyprenyl synthetase family protein n=1 Tax=Amphibiibacter pelophylacis TaxID=1799477 RepID=A0ACC6P0S9_9BURK